MSEVLTHHHELLLDNEALWVLLLLQGNINLFHLDITHELSNNQVCEYLRKIGFRINSLNIFHLLRKNVSFYNFQINAGLQFIYVLIIK